MFEIGTTLREARVRRKLTLQQVEEDTKIRVKYLQAMENEDFDLMPGKAYVKGFLQTYADVPRPRPRDHPRRVPLARRCRARSTSPSAAPRSSASRYGHRRRNTLAFIAVACLLVLAVIYVLGLQR